MTLTNYFGPNSSSMTATRIEGLMGNSACHGRRIMLSTSSRFMMMFW